MTSTTTASEVLQRHRAAVRTRLLEYDHERAGPDSITWKINREVIVVAGWGRAILLQLAHPSIAAGVDHHSAFRGSLLASGRRLSSTVNAMLAITFGGLEDLITAAAGINAIHDRVCGPVNGTGAGCPARERRYSAHDPDLQRWVHATLLESIPLVYERFLGPLTLGEKDQYCAEAAIMEPLLGMPPGWLPRSSSQLDAYMHDMVSGERLRVTDTSRALARAVLYPPRWYVAWPAFRAMQLLTLGSLPARIRTAYGFEWHRGHERSLERWAGALRMSLRALPAFARHWPVARRGGVPKLSTAPHTLLGER